MPPTSRSGTEANNAAGWILMPLKRYAEFYGRSTRREFWCFVLFQFLVMLVLPFLILSRRDVPYVTPWIVLLIALAWLGLIIPNVAVMARRLHDQGITAWILLIGLVPYFGALAILVMMCLPGTRGPNRFGPDPRGRSALAPDLAKVFE